MADSRPIRFHCNQDATAGKVIQLDDPSLMERQVIFHPEDFPRLIDFARNDPLVRFNIGHAYNLWRGKHEKEQVSE